MTILNKNRALLILLFILLIFITMISLGFGSIRIDIKSIIEAVINHFFYINKIADVKVKIIFELRLPRIILAGIIGAVLAISGLVYQTILKNPLTEPFTLGISSGASFGAGLGMFFLTVFTNLKLPIFLFSFLGGGISILIIFLISMKKNVTIFTILFVGIIISFFFNAGLTLVLFLLGNKTHELILWTMGSFDNIPENYFFTALIITSLISASFTFLQNRKLDIFYFSDNLIKNMGLNPNITRGLLFFISSIPVIIGVSICGIIGFVGLIVPHVARFIFGNRHKILIPACGIIGAILLIVSDDISRSLLSYISSYGQEIPVGVVTSLIGSPFFLYYILKERKSL